MMVCLKKSALRGLGALAAAVLGLSPFASARADSWLPAERQVVLTADGATRIEVEPRDLKSALAYFSDAVKNQNKPGQARGGKEAATFVMSRKVDGRWRELSRGDLLNDVSPVDTLIANAGRFFVTLDNWHAMGFGDTAVVLYDGAGTVLHRYALTDLFGEDFTSALPRSASSLRWRRGARIDDGAGELVIDVVLPGQSSTGDPATLEARLGLADGAFRNIASAQWVAAFAKGRDVAAANRQAEAKAKARFLAPLTPPQGSDEAEWHAYLREAFNRLDPDWLEGSTDTNVLRAPDAADYKPSEGWLHDALTGRDWPADAVAIASPASLDNLVAVLERMAKRIKSGSLAQARLYIASDRAHEAAIRRSLAGSGATLVFLYPDMAIPQRAARIEGTPEYEAAEEQRRQQMQEMLDGLGAN